VISAELTLSEMAPGGEAVGRRDDGLVVFVAGGTPGDRVEVALTPPRKGYAHGQLLRVLSPGADRVEPACPLAVPERCGGCPLLAVARPAQLRAKESWVARALRKLPATILPILAPTPDLGYRLRARLEVRHGRLGFAGARSNSSVDIASCPVLVPALERALFGGCAPLAALLGEGATVQGLAGLPSPSSGVQLAVRFGRGAQRPAAQASLDQLIRLHVVDCVLYEEEGGSAAVALGSDSDWGPFFSTADGFAQPSAAGHSLLPRLVAEAAFAAPSLASARVLELFSGSGNLSRALRPAAKALHCVEGDPRAAARAQALFAGDAAVTVEARPVEAALRTLVSKGASFDVIVLDPPRTGAREAVPLLAQLGAQRIVYVSCDPMTLGRDLGELSGHGYLARTVQPIDLTPHAAHVESLAIAERSRERV
jgi:23S rRNA (uracil1939-C5)-methyltransferase